MNYQDLRDRITRPLGSVETLLTILSPPLEWENDDFGDVEDDDIMFTDLTRHKHQRCPSKRTTGRYVVPRTNTISPTRSSGVDRLTSLCKLNGAIGYFQRELLTLFLAVDEYDENCGENTGGGFTIAVSPLIALMKVSMLVSA